jgi:N-acetylneuraminate synthase
VQLPLVVRRIRLGGVEVTDASPPYVVAEIGVNHGGSMELARRLIDLAADGGADAAKFQTYKAEHLASRHSPAYWDISKETTTSQFELFKKYDAFGEREYQRLADHCRDRGIEFLSTPFHDEAVDFLDPLVPFFKIASADLNNVPLLRKIGSKKKPVVLSTGAALRTEVDMAINTLQRAGCSDIALLHCVLNYPTNNEVAHLGVIQGLRNCYPHHVIGYSDHTVPDAAMTALTVAHVLGAAILEKHFTHDKMLPGNDHYHAMDVDDLKAFRARIAEVRALIGPQRDKVLVGAESPARLNARRSIVLSRDVVAGQTLTTADLTCKRPGTGITADCWDQVIGLKIRRALPADTVLSWSDLADPPAAHAP